VASGLLFPRRRKAWRFGPMPFVVFVILAVLAVLLLPAYLIAKRWLR
jgi:hypothetical protein